MKCLIADWKVDTVTGGEVFNARLFETLSRIGCTVDYLGRTEYSCHGAAKLKIPFLELKHLKKIRSCETVFWNSSLMNRHLPLLLLARLTGKQQNITILHHFDFEQHSGLRRWIYRFKEYCFLHLCDTVICPNPYPRERLKRDFRRKKILVIPLPLEKSTLQAEPQPGRLLFVGTIEPRKGLLELAECLHLLRQRGTSFHCDIVGKTVSEPYARQLRNAVADFRLTEKVKFHGYVTDEQLQNFYRHASVFVFPSHLEGHGMVISEAMRYGLPTVAFANSAMPYTIRNGKDGVLVPDRDCRAMADAVECLLRDPEKRTALACGMQETLKNLPGEAGFEAAVLSAFEGK